MEQLLANLQEQLNIIQTLTEAARQERDCITAGDTVRLESFRQNKERFRAKLLDLEQQRSALSQGKTLRELAALPEAPASELLALRQTMQQALRELQNENDTNMIYLKHELAYISCFREATTAEEHALRYTKRGNLAQQPQLSGPVISIFA